MIAEAWCRPVPERARAARSIFFLLLDSPPLRRGLMRGRSDPVPARRSSSYRAVPWALSGPVFAREGINRRVAPSWHACGWHWLAQASGNRARGRRKKEKREQLIRETTKEARERAEAARAKAAEREKEALELQKKAATQPKKEKRRSSALGSIKKLTGQGDEEDDDSPEPPKALIVVFDSLARCSVALSAQLRNAGATSGWKIRPLPEPRDLRWAIRHSCGARDHVRRGGVLAGRRLGVDGAFPGPRRLAAAAVIT